MSKLTNFKNDELKNPTKVEGSFFGFFSRYKSKSYSRSSRYSRFSSHSCGCNCNNNSAGLGA